MEYRELGRTGLRVPEIGFGCGNVGGMMVRGSHEAQISAVQHALALGIDYFDTAAMYGDGLSETHLGEVLAELKPDVRVATKAAVRREDLGDIAGAVRRSLEASLTRLQLDSVDLLQLHTNLANGPDTERFIDKADVLRTGGVADVFDALKGEGLIRHMGITGMGDTDALHEVIESGRFETVQCYHNVLNPSAGVKVGPGFVGQDYRELMAKAGAQGMGVIVIRVVAGGALGGPVARQGLASKTPGEVTGSGIDYDDELRRTEAISFLTEGGATPVQASIRLALDNPATSVVLVGYSDEGQIDEAVAAADLPSITPDQRTRLAGLWDSDFRV
ncbi:MAG: aldo/keto reductase [Dehalococcoidia bacterium]